MNRISHGLPMPAQTYAHIERMVVDVQDVGVILEPSAQNASAGTLPVSLQDQALLYFTRKFEAQAGAENTGRLVVKITDAHVEHSLRESDSRLLQKIDIGKVDQYLIQLGVTLQHQDANGLVLYGRDLSVRKMFEVSEHDSLADEEQKRFTAIEDMFNILDPEVSRVIGSEMGL